MDELWKFVNEWDNDSEIVCEWPRKAVNVVGLAVDRLETLRDRIKEMPDDHLRKELLNIIGE